MSGDLPSVQAALPKMGRVTELDGLRGVAALMIVALHYIIAHLQVAPGSLVAYGQAYFGYLWAGVDIFFVLSGYLLGGILLDNRASPNGLRVFYARRATRILPPYALLLVSYLAVSVWWTGAPRAGLEWLMANPIPMWSYLFFVHNFEMAVRDGFGALFLAATWSLAVEEQFYLLLPWIVRRAAVRRLPHICVGFIVCALAARLALYIAAPQNTIAQTVLLLMRWDSLFFGVLAAYLVRYKALPAIIRDHPSAYRAILFIAAITALAIPFAGRGHGALFTVMGYSVIAFLAALLLVHIAVKKQGLACRLLRARLLTYFGKISYTIYLFHTAFLGILFSLFLKTEPRLATMTDWLVLALAFAFTVLFAELSWRYLESPLIRLGHRLKYGGARAPAAANIALEGA